jgi:hypothetical protein
MKKDIFGDDTTKNLGFKILEKTPKHAHLQVSLAQWQNIIDSAQFDNEIIMTNNRAKHWYILSIKAKTQIKNIISILQRTRHEEWIKPNTTSFTLASMALLQIWFILKYVVDKLQVFSIQQSLVNWFIEL